VIRKAIVLLASMSGALLAHNNAFAQGATTPATADQIDFTANSISYENDADIVTASGDVRMVRNLDRVRADKIIWNRKTGQVRAEGNVSAISSNGDTVYGDVAILEDTLKDGVVENLLLVLADGARLAARTSKRTNEVTTLDDAAYSPCPVISSDNCPRNPSWQISAVKIIHDPIRKEIVFKGARLEMFGVPLFVVPTLSQPLGTDGRSGFLIPALQYTRTNGLEVELPYYFRLKSNRDLTVTPHVYSSALPAIEAKYRALTENGAYQVSGFATYGSRIPTATTTAAAQRAFRGYLDASGRFQLDPQWSVSGSIRRATDRTFLRRYDISRDDRLRSTLKLERIDPKSYFSLTGWSIQTLRSGDAQGQIPVALPEIDYRRRFADPVLGGKFDLQLNSLALGRSAGQDTQRAFAGLRWDLRKLTAMGQEVLFTVYGRGDIYHSDENLLTTTALYRGNAGYQARAIGALAGEIRWPLIGTAFGGTQRITPRIQIVASPRTSNLDIPNEDARAVDLEDSNLFALNRFPGFDRWEDGTRLTYGFDYAFDAPGWAVTANVGQSYRLININPLLPDGTGLNNQVSDIVGRTTVRFRDMVSASYRFRLDKDNFTPRRQEFDATIGNRSTYATIGYLRLNRNIGSALEDLRDREEIRVGGRVQITKFVSLFGSAVVDLTDRAEDPLSSADGYEPIRHRLGIAYTDECLDIGLTWRRDYDTTGDARAGNSYLLRLVFRGLGR
jgi:LPS-assembly protein